MIVQQKGMTAVEWKKWKEKMVDMNGDTIEMCRDSAVPCEIHNRVTGEIVDHFTARHDNFKKECRSRVEGRKDLFWKAFPIVG